MIRVVDLHKTYPTRFGAKHVLRGINFELAMGERLGILGRNGAGKSTLVRLISGAERPSLGKVETGMSVSWPLAFGGAFQPNLTGRDNVRFISRIYGQDAQANLAFVEKFAELGPYIDEEVRTYSAGMRARLGFAISMIIEFDCFLIDEVAAVGDARFHERCNRELFQKRADRAMIIISHDASYLRDHCTRFAVLDDGWLELFADFDAAYTHFRSCLGLAAREYAGGSDLPQDRSQLIEAAQTLSVQDEAFRAIVQNADWQRDEECWAEAEATYGEALALYPYQRSYWVQKGHCAKEALADLRSECAYRTAIALGEPPADVREHLAFVIARQGHARADLEERTYFNAPAQLQPPGEPDIALFARIFWKSGIIEARDVATFLRENSTCDAALCAMLADPRCVSVRGAIQARDAAPLLTRTDAVHLVAIACPGRPGKDAEKLISRLLESANPAQTLLKAGGFCEWDACADALAMLEQAA